MKHILTPIFALTLTLAVQGQDEPRPFITTWQTGADNETVTIPTDTANHTYSYTVNWGDNSTDNNTYTENASHTYAAAGTYTITISGTFPSIRLAQVISERLTPTPAAGQIRTVEQWGDIEWASMALAFAGCGNLTINAADAPDLSEVTDARGMFLDSSLDGDISTWEVSNVMDMWSMFRNSSFNGDLSEWNVSSVKNMANLFRNSSFNGDISEWDMSSVTDTRNMFLQSSFTGDISKWDVSSVTTMRGMFVLSSFNGDLSEWDVSNVKDMYAMFYQSSFNGDLSEWNVSNVKDMANMFVQSPLNGDISKWDVSSVTNMEGMFAFSSFNGDISEWNVSSVKNMANLFRRSPSFNGDISEWNVSSVTNMGAMFYLSPFNGDLSEWNVSSVTDMNNMFRGSPFNGNLSEWNVSNVKDMEIMFAQSLFNQDISKWDISSVTTMRFMFFNNSSMSSENYDKLLIGWSTLAEGETRIPSGILFGAPDRYSCRGKVGRDTLTMRYKWNISGDELVPIRTDIADLPAVIAQCEITAADLTAPTAKNKCDGTGTTVTATHNIPDDAFPITSDTVITWTYTDNNKSIVQRQEVIVNKIISDTPSLNELTAQCPIASLTVPTAMNCSGESITATTTTATLIHGKHTITWTYTDAGNTATQTQQVTINDTTAPEPDIPSLPTVTEQCEMDLTVPTATDNCDGEIMATTDVDFPMTASATVTWTYED